MLQRALECHSKSIKYCFTKWRDLIRLKEDHKHKIVIKLLTRKHRNSIKKYFS
jgi:hypothetical protein